MADKKIKLDLEIATKEANANLKAAAKEAKKLGTELDDTRTAGQKLADGISNVADEMQSEFKQAASAAGKLETALGDDTVMAFKQAGKSVDDLVADLKHAGLTYEEIEADVDALAMSMKKLNSVGQQIDTHITKNMQGVARETDNSRSVMANFAGNAAQELPGMAAAFGPLNMAIGQFTEYAAEGNISMKGLAATAGPMLGAAVAVQMLNTYLQQVAKVKAWRKDAVDAYAESIKNGTNAADDLLERLKETGKVEWKLNRMFGGDIADELDRAGISAEQFTEAVTGGDLGTQKFTAALQAAGVEGADYGEILIALGTHQDLYREAIDKGTAFTRVFGDATETAGNQADTAAKDFATLDVALAGLLGTLDEEDAYRNVADGWDTVKESAEAAFIAASEGADDSEAKLRDHEQAVDDQKRAVIAYADEIGNVKPSVVTEILALIDEGKWAEADARIQTLDDPVNKYVRVITLGEVGYMKNALGTASAPRSGPSLVGETGPEIVNLNKGDSVTGSSQTSRILNGAKGESVYNDNRTINVSMPPASPEATYASLEKYLRKSGRE
jgi:hypothetical protein